jgi:hypothetical protein
MYDAAKRLLDRVPPLKGAVLEIYRWYYALGIFYQIHFHHTLPVLIYQMGKVGSSTIYESFPVGKYKRATHLHHLYPPQIKKNLKLLREHNKPVLRHLYQGERIYHHIILPKYPVKIISPVRDPISRNMSMLFQIFQLSANTKYPPDHYSIEELTTLFLENFPHDEAIKWFDEEFKPALDIDVYEYPFPQEKGFLRIHTDWVDVLLLKIELDDKVIEAAIAEFLEVESFSLNYANIGENKQYGNIYKAFREQVILPVEYIDKMLDSRYAKHFYTDDERSRFREKWMARLQN